MKKKNITRKEMKEKKKRTYKCHWSDYCLVWSPTKTNGDFSSKSGK